MPTYLYFLLWGAFFFVMMRFGCGAHIMGHGHGHPMRRKQPTNAFIYVVLVAIGAIETILNVEAYSPERFSAQELCDV